ISKRDSFFLASAVFTASSMISLAFVSAFPILDSAFFFRLDTVTKWLMTAAAMISTTATAIMIPLGTGAPPYLVFIVQIQHLNSILFSQRCQAFHSETCIT